MKIKIHDIKISKSTNSASEKNIISDSKTKKIGERKLKTKTICISDSISFTKSFENILDLYKRTNPEIEKIRIFNYIFISK